MSKPSSPTNHLPGMAQYLSAIQQLQEDVVARQQSVLDEIASRMVTVIQNDGRIFLFGSGHSHMLAEEAFYRAGGLACAVPVFHSGLMLHESAHLSSRLERTPGLAADLLHRYDPQPGEMLFIYSNSGVNHLPVEMALLARQKGLITVAVCSLAYSQVAPLSTLGQRLYEVCDYTLDNGGQPGDALVAIEGSAWRAGPSSTIVASLLWNGLVIEALQRLQQMGIQPPVFASLNMMQGATEHNAVLLEKWRQRNPHLA